MENIEKTLEKKVLTSLISRYKGQLVVRVLGNDDTGGSMGYLMILGTGVKNNHSGQILLRHEHGHFLQFKILGRLKYFFGIFIPSCTNQSFHPYYSQPWEVHADIMAEVHRPFPEHTEEAKALGSAYFEFLESLKGRTLVRFIFKGLWRIRRHDFSEFLPLET